MKIPTLLLFATMPFSIFAQNIQWDIFTVEEGYVWYNWSGSSNLDVSFKINPQPINNGPVWASPDYSRIGTLAADESFNSGAWLAAVAGDLVDSSTMLNAKNYFFYEMANADPNAVSSEWIEMPQGDYGYLKFVIEDGTEAIDFRYGLRQEPPTVYYGWAEYFVDNDGTFEIVHSAIDFDGGPMIVGAGAVPEPTGGLLLLLGTAALFLRRRVPARRSISSRAWGSCGCRGSAGSHCVSPRGRGRWTSPARP